MPRGLAPPDRVVLLLSLVPYLIEHGETPLAELAGAFGIDARELRELVEFLATAGVPGETSTYQDEDLFDIDWSALEEEGVVRLTRAVAVDDAPRFSAIERAALAAGLQVLEPLLPESERAHVRSAAAKLASAAGPADPAVPLTATAEAEDPRLALLAEAIDAGRRVAFAYRDLRGARSERTVDPLALVQSGSAWYLRAHCLDREAERTFLVDGMRELRALAEQVGHRPAAHPRAPGIGPSEAAIPALLRVRDGALHRIAGFAPRALGPAGPGWLRAEVDLAHPGAAVRLVQAAPGDLVIEAPEEAREAVLAWAERALAQYDA